jgi:hypothetical protein
LASLGNVTFGKFQLPQSGLEKLKAISVIDSHPELGGVPKKLPSLAAIFIVKSEMGFLSIARTGVKIIQDMVIALASRNISDSASFQPVVQQL